MMHSPSSSTTSGTTLAIDRRSSLCGTVLVLALAALSLIGLFATTHPAVFLPLAAIVTIYATWCVYRLHLPRVARLMLQPDNRVVIVPARVEDNMHGELAGTPFVSPWLICMGVRVSGRRRSFCFFPDSTDADTFRRLAARLRNL